MSRCTSSLYVIEVGVTIDCEAQHSYSLSYIITCPCYPFLECTDSMLS